MLGGWEESVPCQRAGLDDPVSATGQNHEIAAGAKGFILPCMVNFPRLSSIQTLDEQDVIPSFHLISHSERLVINQNSIRFMHLKWDTIGISQQQIITSSRGSSEYARTLRTPENKKPWKNTPLTRALPSLPPVQRRRLPVQTEP